MMSHDEIVRILGEDAVEEYERLTKEDKLIKRAAELLLHFQIVFPNWYRSDIEEWLKDAGVKK